MVVRNMVRVMDINNNFPLSIFSWQILETGHITPASIVMVCKCLSSNWDFPNCLFFLPCLRVLHIEVFYCTPGWPVKHAMRLFETGHITHRWPVFKYLYGTSPALTFIFFPSLFESATWIVWLQDFSIQCIPLRACQKILKFTNSRMIWYSHIASRATFLLHLKLNQLKIVAISRGWKLFVWHLVISDQAKSAMLNYLTYGSLIITLPLKRNHPDKKILYRFRVGLFESQFYLQAP